MPSRIAALLCLCVLSGMAFTGCSKKQATAPIWAPPKFVLRDSAGVIPPHIQRELAKIAAAANDIGLRVAVVVVPRIESREPGRFADDVLRAFPFDVTELTRGKLSKDQQTKAFAWRPAGILILASLEPRLVMVRMGDNARSLVTDKTLHALLEAHVYPQLEAKNAKRAIVECLRAVVAEIRASGRMPAAPGRLQYVMNSGISEIRDYGYPERRIYYALFFDPLINSLALLLSIGGYRAWLIIPWFIAVYMICRQEFALRALRSVVYGAVVRTARLWRHLINSEQALGRFSSVISCATGIGVKLLSYGMGIPVFAVLYLVVMPLWENVYTVRSHLYPWVSERVDAHAVCALHGGLLWFATPREPAGIGLAVVIGAVALLGAIAGVVLTGIVGVMDAETAESHNIPFGYWATQKAILKASEYNSELGVQYILAPLVSSVVVPAAAAMAPFVLVLYYLAMTFEEAATNLRAAWTILPRLRDSRPRPGNAKTGGSISPVAAHSSGYLAAMAAQDYQKALRHADWLARTLPLDLWGRCFRATALMALGEWSRAERDLRYILLFRSHLRLGNEDRRIDDVERARRAFFSPEMSSTLANDERRIDVSELMVSSRVARACACVGAKNPAEAERILRRTRREFGSRPPVDFLLGSLQVGRGDPRGAALTKTAAAEDPQHPLIAASVDAMRQLGIDI